MKVKSSLRTLRMCATVVPLLGMASGRTMGQETPVARLVRPDAEFIEPFSQVDGVRELRDGRVIVVDSREHLVTLLDRDLRTSALVGRKGSGPREYQAPLSVFALPGDSAAVFDGGMSRLLLISPDARPGAFVSTSALRATSGGIMTRFVPTRGDALGRLYASGVPVDLTPQGPRHADSFPVLRWNRIAPQTEAVAFLRNRSLTDRGGDIDPQGALFVSLIPFVVGDQWAVDADGRVAILRYDDYRVDFVLPSGRRIQGRPIPFERVRVAEAHKAAWCEGEKYRLAGSGFDVKEPPRWPEYLPPFLSRPALFAPGGVLWVLRTGGATAPPTYDLIDAAGRLVRRVTLAARGRVIGFGNGVVYVVRRDDDDLEYIQRFHLP